MRRYITYLSGTTLGVLIVAAVLSYFVDPGRLYRHDKEENGIAGGYAQMLFSAAYGLSVPEGAIDEREAVKLVLAHPFAGQHTCLVIGSSHIMQISSARRHRSLASECPDFLNVGVSGAAIEDHLAVVHMAFAGKSGLVRKVVLGMDPWIFMYGRDSRWTTYRANYLHARRDILGHGQKSENRDEPELGKWGELLNGQYVWRSLNMLLQYGGTAQIGESPPLDPEVGGPHPVRLRDGSLVYSAKYLQENTTEPSGCGSSYGTKDYQVQAGAVEDYRHLIRWIKARGAEPIFLMTPYHMGAWNCPNSDNVRAMRATAAAVTQLAGEEHVRVFGSYDPKTIGCQSDEFYDFMHPKAACLARIER